MNGEGKRATVRCAPPYHMRGPMLSLYEYAARLTARKPKRILYASNRTISEAIGYKPRTVGRAKRRLVEKGWFEALGGNRESIRSGRYLPNRYEVITHDDWVASHPGQCQTDKDSGMWGAPRTESTGDGEGCARENLDRCRSYDTDRSRSDRHQVLNNKIDTKSERNDSPSSSRTSRKGKGKVSENNYCEPGSIYANCP